MKQYIIYRATCTNTKKVYIGYTNTNKTLDRRKFEHYNNAFKSNYRTKFANALRKYPDQFIWECLCIVDTHKEAIFKEIEMIAEYDSYKNGYNSTKGGDGGDLSKYRKYVRKHIDEDIQKDIVDMYVSGIGKAEIYRKYEELTYNMITDILERNNIQSLGPINSRNKKEINHTPNGSYTGNNNSQYVHIPEKDKLEMIRLYQSREMTKKEIQKEFGIGYKILTRIFKENNIEKNPPVKYVNN